MNEEFCVIGCEELQKILEGKLSDFQGPSESPLERLLVVITMERCSKCEQVKASLKDGKQLNFYKDDKFNSTGPVFLYTFNAKEHSKLMDECESYALLDLFSAPALIAVNYDLATKKATILFRSLNGW